MALTDLNPKSIAQIKNPAFQAYAAMYERIYDHFMKRVARSGIQIAPEEDWRERDAQLERLRQRGARFRNCGKSIVVNAISPACEGCRTGIGSATYFTSLKCHRNCFYCFNPNQEGFEYFSQHKRDVAAELSEVANQGFKVKHLALTGGEPLLFKDEAVAFFDIAQREFPGASTRIYTCGDLVDDEILSRLATAGLDEIRFSIRLHDFDNGQRSIFDRIALAVDTIPRVMVEMPVMPDSRKQMAAILLELERLGAFGINLLELCYPYRNADEFNRRGYRVKRRPYRVLYNYWYAGGLPIAGSERVCLQLLEYALDQGLNLGVHYCSLENKHTGQVCQQNRGRELPAYATLSSRDFFVKSAKAFGDDVPVALRAFKKTGYQDFVYSSEHEYIEFGADQVENMKEWNPEIGISYYVSENRNGEQVLRELKIDYTTARTFDVHADV
jgi:pyruvate formate-lyase activating enzyme-like uncharacterized protein